MALRVYDTLAKEKREFEPLEPGKVRMYNCGPTVYDRVHIGNLRSFLFADVLRRWLEYRGYDVTQVMNVTDVGHVRADHDEGEDKIEQRAQEEGTDPWKLSARFAELFFEDMRALGALEAHVHPKATEHVPEMLEIIDSLLAKGSAYQVGENVYFDVTSFPRYGRLSGNKVEALEAGARVEVHEDKRHPADFALWKSDALHVMKWPSQFGEHGFPGWHIECSAMARKHLGDRIDIHTGGEDNVFPHHECEIAQSESLTGAPFATYWMHARFLQVDGGKMGKSLGNTYTLPDVLERGFSARALRYCLIRGHYRQPLNFTWDILGEAQSALETLDDLVQRLRRAAGDASPDAGAAVTRARESFEAAMDDDLGMPAALGALFTLRNAAVQGELDAGAAAAALEFLADANRVLAVLDLSEHALDDDVEALIAERLAARAAKDFATSDRIRDELAARGIALEDGPDGTTWRLVGRESKHGA